MGGRGWGGRRGGRQAEGLIVLWLHRMLLTRLVGLVSRTELETGRPGGRPGWVCRGRREARLEREMETGLLGETRTSA